jgi:hypothetical protein
MAGLATLRKIQIGKEVITTKGTPVAATAILLGSIEMRENPTIYRPKEMRGTLASNVRSVKVDNIASLSFKGDASFEQILHWLHASILGGITPTGAGAAKTWTFTPTLSGAGTFDAFTIEYGDNVQAWETEYCMVKKLEISGVMGEPLKLKADIFGRQMTPTTFTPTLPVPSFESALMQKTKLYIGNDNDFTQEKSATLLGFTFTINTGLVPVRYGDGTQLFSSYFEQEKSVELKVTAAFSSSIETERTKYDGSTIRCIRLENKGSLISGEDYKKLTLDVSGVYTDFASLDAQDGVSIVEFTLSSQLATTYTKLFEVVVVNILGTLP